MGHNKNTLDSSPPWRHDVSGADAADTESCNSGQQVGGVRQNLTLGEDFQTEVM